jgi:uncharacterized Zn finger protein (UPF0148 family)
MTIEFSCDCGHEFRVSDKYAGKKVLCPDCEARVRIPDADESDQEELPAARRQKTAQSRGNRSTSSDAARSSKRVSSRQRAETDDDDDFDDASSTRRRSKRREDGDDEFDFPEKRTNNKKKVTKKTSSPKTSNISTPVIAGLAVAMLIAIGGIGYLGYRLTQGSSTSQANALQQPAQTKFSSVSSEDFFFKCQMPEDWNVTTGGGTGGVPPWIKAEKGKIKVAFRASQSGTALGTMTGADQGSGGELPDELKPIHKLHLYQGEKLKLEMKNFKEVGAIERIDTGIGEARLSKFQADGSWGARIYAIRVTLIENQWQWNLICETSSKSEFDRYENLFREIAKKAGTI